MNNIAGRIKTVWDNLIGDINEFSMENRAFNFVCLITFPILIFAAIFDTWIDQSAMTYVTVSLMFVLCFIYYYSRYKKRYNAGIFIYAILSYATLIFNFYINSGIGGPTLLLFFLTFQLLISIGQRRLFPLWIVLHITIACGLLYSQYIHPEWAPDTYVNRRDMYLDIISNFIISIAFMFGMINYLRRSFNNERFLADQRALAIEEQNVRIMEQNQMLERLNDEKNKLFSIVSHDLKSPLDSIRGYLELVAEDVLQGEEKAKMEAELLQRTIYTSDLVLNLLTWARTQMDGVAVNLAPANLHDLIEDIARSKAMLAEDKGISFIHSIRNDVEVVCDKDMLQIVIRNLLNNAIKFTPQGGSVFLSAGKRGDMVDILVKDTGIGVPTDKQKDIFSPRIKSSYGTNKEKGTGLGLMMCKTLMEYQHGEIWFESKERLGTVFYVSLPLAKAQDKG